MLLKCQGEWTNGKYNHDIDYLVSQGYHWLASHTKAPSMAMMQRLGYLAGIDVWEHSKKIRCFRIAENQYVTMRIR